MSDVFPKLAPKAARLASVSGTRNLLNNDTNRCLRLCLACGSFVRSGSLSDNSASSPLENSGSSSSSENSVTPRIPPFCNS